MSRSLIILMTRLPEWGQTKTRLENLFKKKDIVKISERLLNRNFEAVKKVAADHFFWVTSADESLRLQDFLPLGDEVWVERQVGSSLGERMAEAFKRGFDRGYERIVLIGSDLADMSTALLNQALDVLQEKDLVITPTADGGYGLIGMRQAEPRIFSLPTYGHRAVYKQTIDKVKELGLRGQVLGMLHDIDTREDLVRYLTGDEEAAFLAQGEYNANFTLSNGRLFRLPLGSQMHLKHQARYEYEALKALAPSGVVPRVYDLMEDEPLLGLDYFTEEFLPGRPLNYETDSVIAANLLARIHQVPGEQAPHLIPAQAPFQVMMDEFESMFKHYETWEQREPKVAQQIRYWLEDLKANYDLAAPLENPCIINTELNSHNFLINPGEASYVIDWEKPLLGEREQDLAHFLAPTTTLWKTAYCYNGASLERFLEAYEAVSLCPVDRAKLDQYLRFTCLRGVTWCAMAYVEYTEESKASQDLDTFQVIKRFISPAFLSDIAAYMKSLDSVLVVD